MQAAPILIVDNDTDDKHFLEEAWKELDFPYSLVFFNNGEDVLQYLKVEQLSPFLILCDVNLPKMDGFDLKEKIQKHDNMRYRTIPFVFWSSDVSKTQIKRAYDLGGNGFFIKDNTFREIKQSLVDIVEYWRKSKTPY